MFQQFQDDKFYLHDIVYALPKWEPRCTFLGFTQTQTVNIAIMLLLLWKINPI